MYPVHPLPGDHALLARCLSLIDAFNGKQVVVIGDVIADEFIYGRLSRISREAPVLILKYDTTVITPGGAGNAANNAADLGAHVRLVGLVGREPVDRRLVAALRPGVDTSWLVRPPGHRTTVKTRILAGSMHAARQQVVRIDREAPTKLNAASHRRFEQIVSKAVDGCDAVLLSDYGHGLVTANLASMIRRLLHRSTRRRETPILVDSRYDLLRYRGLTACTPNQSEAEQLLGVRIEDDLRALERAGRAILKRTRTKAL